MADASEGSRSRSVDHIGPSQSNQAGIDSLQDTTILVTFQLLSEPNRMGTDTSADGAVVVSNQAPAAVAFVRSLGRRGVETIAAGERQQTPAVASRYFDEAVELPDPFTDLLAYRDALLALAERSSVRTIVPVREPDVYVLAKYRASFGDHVATLWPDAETLERAHDRVALADAARAAGVAVPETELLTAVDSWTDRRIVKARYGFLADRYVDDIEPATARQMGATRYVDPGVPPDVDAVVEEMGHVPIVQEYVEGTEYTIRALYDRGERVLSTGKALRRGMKYPRGPSVYHEAVDIPELEAAGTAVLDELDWHGPASVGFIRDAETGTFKLLEINPRFWASLPCDSTPGSTTRTTTGSWRRASPVLSIRRTVRGRRRISFVGSSSTSTASSRRSTPTCPDRQWPPQSRDWGCRFSPSRTSTCSASMTPGRSSGTCSTPFGAAERRISPSYRPIAAKLPSLSGN